MTQQRWVILGSFVVAALLTPTPDPMNQALLAGPMIGLYQVGIASVWVANRPRRGDQFADAETRATLMALQHRQLITSWYQDFQGSHSLHCRWGGTYEGVERMLITVVIDGHHRLIATPEHQEPI